MPKRDYQQRTESRHWSRSQFDSYQKDQLSQLLDWVSQNNAFYSAHLQSTQKQISVQDWKNLPLTTKQDLIGDDSLGRALNHTWESNRYVRFHRTSGTHGKPLAILDTAEDWQWWIDTWQYVLDAADVAKEDRVFMAFSFGPFIGFWSAHEACIARGAMVIPGGGLSTSSRLDLLKTSEATVLCCTPSYAIHLAESALAQNVSLADFSVRKIIVAGEPGGSIPAIRKRIEKAFRAEVIDHAGATEIGPWGVGSADGNALEIIETEFFPEFLPMGASQTLFPTDILKRSPQGTDECYELVLTNFHRHGCPLIRYRTGDLVRPRIHESGFVQLTGGVLGRADDMLIIRGVNVFPSSLEAILREFQEVDEYRIMVRKEGALDQLTIQVEDRMHAPLRIADRIQVQLGLRVDVEEVDAGTLPRFEGKGKRFVDQR